MAYSPDNPIGSTSPKDLMANAENTDLLALGDNPAYPDRKGRPRKSWKGMEVEHDAAQTHRETQFTEFLDSSGYEPPVPYVAGLTLVRPTQTVTYNGKDYRVKSQFIPLTTTNWAADESKLKLIGDDSLRQELADPTKGVAILGWKRTALSAGVKGAQRFLDAQYVNIWETAFVMLITNKPDPEDPDTWDWTPALQAAGNAVAPRKDSSSGMEKPPTKGGVVKIPTGNYGITKYLWRSYVTIEGEASSNTFIVPFAGASGFLFDLQGEFDRPRGIGIQHLTISPSRNVSVDAGPERAPISALNIQGFEKQCSIDDVKIYNLTGTGIETGDTQDMTINNVEIRFVGKPLNMHSRAVEPGGIVNLTNAIRFTNLRLENNGLSTITGSRAIEFIGGKVERSPIDIINPHGIDFIGVTWALWTEFLLTVSGINRGITLHGGSTDTGLPIGSGNTANFVSTTVPLKLIGVQFRGHGPEAIRGEATPIGCTFSECDRPYVLGGGSTKFLNNNEANLTSGTGNLAPYNRTPASSYEVSTGILPKAPVRETWYQNTTMQSIEVCLTLPYDTKTQASSFQVKKRHHIASEYIVGEFGHYSGGGVGRDTLIVSLLPGESYWYNRSGGATDATMIAFYR